MRRRRPLAGRKPKNSSGNIGFNMMMGAGGVQSSLSQFKNPKSTNSIATYNPFRETLEATGADNN